MSAYDPDSTEKAYLDDDLLRRTYRSGWQEGRMKTLDEIRALLGIVTRDEISEMIRAVMRDCDEGA